MKGESIRKFEHSTLRIGENGFTEDHFNELAHFNDLHQSRYFTVGHKKIQFTSYVGAIQVGNLVIEILPKGDKTNDINKWHNALIQILKVTRYVKLEVTDRAMLHSSKNHLIELLFRTYLGEVSWLIRTGVIKRYITISENSNALKGKLDFHKNIQHNYIHKERFYNEYNYYSQDNIYNQILKLALQIVLRISSSLPISTSARNIMQNLSHVSDIHPNSINFRRLILDRKTRDYRDALTLAKMIILNHSSELQRGRMPLIAFLFDMNELFEDFIYKSFKREENRFSNINLNISG